MKRHQLTLTEVCLSGLLSKCSDIARCLRVKVHEKPDLPDAFYKCHMRELAMDLGTMPSQNKKMNLGLAKMQFPAVFRGLLARFLVDILAHFQFLPPSVFLCRFGQITRPIFSKSGGCSLRRTEALPVGE